MKNKMFLLIALIAFEGNLMANTNTSSLPNPNPSQIPTPAPSFPTNPPGDDEASINQFLIWLMLVGIVWAFYLYNKRKTVKP
jgi:hypothetical protein